MSRRPRPNHAPAFKAKVALAAIHPNQITQWNGTTSGRGRRSVRSRQQQLSVAAGRRREVAARKDRRADAGERLFRRIAQQSRSFERKAMIDPARDLPITKLVAGLLQPWHIVSSGRIAPARRCCVVMRPRQMIAVIGVMSRYLSDTNRIALAELLRDTANPAERRRRVGAH